MVQANKKSVEIKVHAIDEALALVKESAKAKFDESIDMVIQLGVDTRKHAVRGSVGIASSSSWKSINIIAFTDDDSEWDALSKAGVIHVGGDELIADIKAEKIDVSKVSACVAKPSMMKKLAPVSRVLGPKGLMPNPKTGTVSDDLLVAVAKLQQGTMNIRADRYGLVHVSIGKASFSVDDLKANLMAVFAEVKRLKPAAAKGVYFKKCHVSSTMGAGIPVEIAQNI